MNNYLTMSVQQRRWYRAAWRRAWKMLGRLRAEIARQVREEQEVQP